jgi:hypothetical protein
VKQVIKFKHGVGKTLRGGPVDLAKMGRISVHRSSDIRFDEDRQKYYIHFLEPALEGWNHIFNGFPTYEAAVEKEVELINLCRKTAIL